MAISLLVEQWRMCESLITIFVEQWQKCESLVSFLVEQWNSGYLWLNELCLSAYLIRLRGCFP